ncbi:MAG TPA: argininosuccinate lyase [Candidatus Latescibacteria bacterium]|nr:argininosuccinate lyase [Candidatus Latescibacterota bacterium]HQE60755.1 argininosuccinate lyase [Candidatus Latescibacterota bacterium]HQI76118.1 argininosuccinate lyase [Candidatus Latescibacterota bacterium]
MTTGKLWDGRFSRATDQVMEEFNASIGFDIRLWEADIEGNLAQADALRQCGILTSEEWSAIVLGLQQVRQELAGGSYRPGPDTEDIHMAVERRLIEIVGPVGGKIHTGRSRNDQVALDVRLYLRRAVGTLTELVSQLQAVVLKRAEAEVDAFLPGYTHLQPAQPVRLAHYLLAFFWMLDRDKGRLRDALRRADEMPLGSGALAGTAFPIDREFVARRLGFARPTRNSMDAVSSRDHLTETVSAIAILMTNLSRLAEDWVVWSSPAFGFVELDDAYATGSSMMPQKKNPDSLELVRGKSGRVFGDLMALVTIQKGLAFTYGKDLQEDKEPLFDALETADICLRVLKGVVETAVFNHERMRAAIEPGMYATDLADVLVRRGLPFRDAHRVVGELVGKAIARGCSLVELPWEEFAQASPLFKREDVSTLSPAASTDRRNLFGGTGRNAVVQQLALARASLKE